MRDRGEQVRTQPLDLVAFVLKRTDCRNLPGQRKHLGDVYLDGRSVYEVGSPEEVSDPRRRDDVTDDWTARTVPVPDAGIVADHTGFDELVGNAGLI